jgi:hypothetical protein
MGLPLPIHFSGNLQFKKFVTAIWKQGGILSFLEHNIISTLFFKNMHEEFLQHIWVHYASQSTFSKRKTAQTHSVWTKHKIFNFGLSLVCSVISCGLLLPQIFRLCWKHFLINAL